MAPSGKPAPERAGDRDKALEAALVQIERQFGKGSVMRLGEQARVPVDVIPTGSIALDGAAHADFIFQTPTGISPGQSFNVVFFDSIGDSALSSNIADYNAAITSAASGIHYSGGTIGSWSIIGATPTADESARATLCRGVLRLPERAR